MRINGRGLNVSDADNGRVHGDPADRRQRAFRAARRHSLRVRGLRIALPLCATAATVAFMATATLRLPELDGVSVDAVAIKDGRVSMERPRMTGFDGQERPFQVEAERASHALANPDRVDLERIDAEVPFGDRTRARVVAGRGTFDNTAQTLKLTDEVEVKGETGMRILLRDASIDMKSGAMSTENGVKVSDRGMRIEADAVAVEESGANIHFHGRVRTVIEDRAARPQGGEPKP